MCSFCSHADEEKEDTAISNVWAGNSDLFYIATDSGEGLLVFGMTIDCHIPFNLPTCSTDRS